MRKLRFKEKMLGYDRATQIVLLITTSGIVLGAVVAPTPWNYLFQGAWLLHIFFAFTSMLSAPYITRKEDAPDQYWMHIENVWKPIVLKKEAKVSYSLEKEKKNWLLVDFEHKGNTEIRVYYNRKYRSFYKTYIKDDFPVNDQGAYTFLEKVSKKKKIEFEWED